MLFYEFPEINKIDEVILYAQDKEYFSIIDKNDYKLITYHALGDKTFPKVIDNETSIYREFRGISFDEDGNIASRPFHKFFNINENEEVHFSNIDFSQKHVILEKLDGSMVRTIKTKKGWRLATKRGITEISCNAEEFIADKENYNSIINFLTDDNFTLIFEWCSRKNRIVLDYPEDRLVLTGIRHNITGEYVTYDFMFSLAASFCIDCVKSIQFKTTPKSYLNGEFKNFEDYLNQESFNVEQFIEHTKTLKDQEGYVIRFDNGHMFKVKADDYLKVHRALSNFHNEKNIIALIIDEKTDDLKAVLDNQRKDYLSKFEVDFFSALIDTKKKIDIFYEDLCSLGCTKKDFALNYAKSFNNMEASLIYAKYDGKNTMDFMLMLIRKNCCSLKNLEKVKIFFKDVIWNNDGFLFGEL